MRLHLTDLSVRALKPTAANNTYWDDTTPGFGIRVGRRSKTWTIMRGHTRERVTIGRYPDRSLAEARAEAKMLLAQAPDPKTIRVVFEKAKDEFIEENYRDASLRSKREAKRLLERHFAPLFKRNLVDIDDTDIKRRLDTMKHTPSEQLHAYRIVRCFLKWCTRPPRKYIKHSPMEGYEPPSKDRRGTRILSDDELRAVWKAAEVPPHSVVRLLILWGTRNSETVAIRRNWVSDDILTIPGSHTKNGRDHGIPLLPLAQSVLDAFPATGAHYVTSRWGESHLSSGAWSKIRRELQAKSGTKNWQLRDIRRTFRSNMARLKVPRDLAEVLINHAPPVLDEIYDRYDRVEEKREALRRYEAWLQTLLRG